jgi:light-regulated signal transduction histidine kinase (bacteriophytochrome)
MASMDNFAPTPVEQADREFERFICSACHNLRELLREIRLRAELTPGSGGAPRSGCAPLEDMEDQIRAMESVLDGMVEYSIACGGGNVHSRIEIPIVLSQVLFQLDKQIQQSAAVVTQDHLPMVMGDSSQIATVLRHLLENAIKFHGADAPRIHISAKRVGNYWELSVRDQGPGIEAPYRERVFLPFKRLHGRDYPGNGLGLAICKKLIARHNGKIWVESEPGDGATFKFTLPTGQ